MKMDSMNAMPWFGNLPPILARIFRQQAAERFSAGTIEVETAGTESPLSSLPRTREHPDIIVPIDFSPGSGETLDYAINVARRAGARLLLLHAIHLNLTPYGPANPGWLRTGLCREAREKMKPMRLRVQAAGVPVISVIEEGVPAAVIATAAKRWNTDLIVMSAAKRSRLARLFGQRTREKVVRETECPVIVLHTHPKKGTTI